MQRCMKIKSADRTRAHMHGCQVVGLLIMHSSGVRLYSL